MKKLLKKLLELLYPPRCVICDSVLPQKNEGCCPGCRQKLKETNDTVCMCCGKQLEAAGQEYCSDCQKGVRYFDQGTAVFVYNEAIRKSVGRMKFQNRRDYIPFFADTMYAHAVTKVRRWDPELILPVPMHPSKKRKRGYNQSELLAVQLSQRTGIPVNTRLLQCRKKTGDQKKLDRRQRKMNLREVFWIDKSERIPVSVLIVDDVYTTGSTMDAVSYTLKLAGVKRVYFLVMCTGKEKRRFP